MQDKNKPETHVAIVGAGITGLATAFYLQREANIRNIPIQITCIESSGRVGGKIRTIYRDGYTIECGPDSFLERKKHATQLATDLGLANELINNDTGTAYILKQQQLIPIPKGSVMGIPTQFPSFMRTPLVSLVGKLRAGVDLFLSPDIGAEDISVGQFFRKRLGDEVVEEIVEPLLSGVYGNAIDQLSLQATFPQYVNLLEAEGSLIRALRRNKSRKTQQPAQGLFQTLHRGLGHMVKALEEQLPVGSIYKNTVVKQVEKMKQGYKLHLDNGDILCVDGLVMTTPHEVTKQLLAPYVDLRLSHDAKPTSVATVALAFAEQDLKIPFEGTGLLVPRSTGLSITACTWIHKKWPHMVPKGKAMLRCFVGRPENDALIHETDEKIVATVLDDLNQIKSIAITEKPSFYYVNRLKKSRPPYEVGHMERLREIKQQITNTLPGVYLAGSSYEGVGIPDCIDQGKQAVSHLIKWLETSDHACTIQQEKLQLPI